MKFTSWLDGLTSISRGRRAHRTPSARPRRTPATGRLSVETLEDRLTPAAFLAVADAVTAEGNTGTQNALVTVTVSEPHGNSVKVSYKTVDGTAKAGTDYTGVSGTLTFAKGENSKTILVPVRGDRTAESDEAFSVQLSNATGAKIADGVGVVTIVDDEPRVFISEASAVEGNAGTTAANFTVSLSGAYDQAVTVNFTTADGSASAGSDYVAASGTLTFNPGQPTSQTVAVLVNGDRDFEYNETFVVTVTTPNSYAVIGWGAGTGTIVDDEPRISVSDAYYYDDGYSDPSITFTVTLSAADMLNAVTVDFATWDGLAVAGIDYVARSGTLTFAPGETYQTFTIEVLNRYAYDQYFSVQLSNPSNNSAIQYGTAYGYLNYYGYYDYGYGGYYDYGYGWY